MTDTPYVARLPYAFMHGHYDDSGMCTYLMHCPVIVTFTDGPHHANYPCYLTVAAPRHSIRQLGGEQFDLTMDDRGITLDEYRDHHNVVVSIQGTADIPAPPHWTRIGRAS